MSTICARLWLPAALLLLAPGCGGGGGGPQGPGAQSFVASAASRAYVRSDTFTRLVLEIDSVAGFAPLAANQDEMESRLAAILDKPAGVEAVLDGTIASRGSDHRWTFPELAQLAAATFDRSEPAGTVKMHVLFVDGTYDAPEGAVLGLAWAQTHLVIFRQSVEEACAATGLPFPLDDALCAQAELAIWMHEVGHLLGLVDGGLPMQVPHEDASHPGHDANPDCVMYWAYEGDALVERLADDLLGGGNGALDFDADCLADIAALRDA